MMANADPLAKVDAIAMDVGPGVRPRGLDVLLAILPPDRLDRMADVLTKADIATLAHVARAGTGANTMRAIASDLGYLEGWSVFATGTPLPWPASEALILKFIAHHLYDARQRERDASHGMPHDVASLMKAEGLLRVKGPHAPGTVRRRLALWSTMHRWRGLEGPFGSPSVRNAMRLAVRASGRQRTRKSARAVTRDVLDMLLDACEGTALCDVRDRALLLAAFAAGGRRRSEAAALRVEDLSKRDVAPLGEEPGAPALPCLEWRLGRTKTGDDDDDERVLLIGRSASAVIQWIALAGLRSGAVFRSIDRFGRLGTRALDGQSVNAILKKRCAAAGLDPEAFSAHGLRSGYLTEAARRGVPLQEAMRQSRHRSVQQAADYYNEATLELGMAARLA